MAPASTAQSGWAASAGTPTRLASSTALTTEIRGLLDGPRADLAALTRALLAYQDQVSGERTA